MYFFFWYSITYLELVQIPKHISRVNVFLMIIYLAKGTKGSCIEKKRPTGINWLIDPFLSIIKKKTIFLVLTFLILHPKFRLDWYVEVVWFYCVITTSGNPYFHLFRCESVPKNWYEKVKLWVCRIAPS